MHIQTINPSTEQVINKYDLHDAVHIKKVIESANKCFQDWRKTPYSSRCEMMLQIAKILLERKLELAKLIASEMGKPITNGIAEIEKCAFVCEHYAKNAESYLAPREITIESSKRFIHHLPLGIIFAIMPWNFPFWQVFRFAAPNIMAGNAVILKHAPITTGCGSTIVELFKESGFPPSLFQQLIIDEIQAESVIANQHIVGITLTGSERAGRAVASSAGAHLKKCVLELGGNDPYIVLKDAEIDITANTIVASRLNNTGQVCIAAKRIIVVRDIEDALINRIKELLPLYVMGNPLDANVKLGPMARKDLRETVHQQIQDTIRDGAKLVDGGIIPEGVGYFYPPTILTGVMPGMRAFEEEVFGPLFSIVSARDESDAISLANQSKYGLSAAIFTRDIEKAKYIATNLVETGTCYINSMVSSDPRIPFGGIKNSGFGRELSKEGILEFVNVKTIGY